MAKEMIRENLQKKIYLQSYRAAVQQIGRLEDERNEIITDMASAKAINYDGMPHASGNNSDLSDMMIRLDGVIGKINAAINEKWELRKEIRQAIEALNSENEKTILYYRYIHYFTWEQIAERMSYSLQHVYYLHGDALNHFEIPKK